MFNNLLKKASETSFAALASEALDSRPGSPASAKRPPGSPLVGQQNGASGPIAKNVDQLKEENGNLNEELQEARAIIKAMRESLENKAADEFLSPKIPQDKEALGTQDNSSSSASAALGTDPLGAVLVSGTDELAKKTGTLESTPTSLPVAPAETTGPESIDVSDPTELKEKIRDLTRQLSEAKEQHRQLEVTLAQRTSEVGKQKTDHDEKMKKMKAIFAAANKNLNEYRQSIAVKDEEIAELKTQLENRQPSDEQTNEQNQAIKDLEAELRNQSELAAIRLQQMESKFKQSNTQLEKLKIEYQQYKQRASTLLQQQREAVQSDDDSKVRELQNQLDALTKENKSIATELQDAESRRSALEGELQLAMDQIASLESSHEISRRQERQNARQLKDLERSLKEAQREREAAESRIASLQELKEAETHNLMQELGGNTKYIEDRLAKKEEENAELHRILDRSSDELAAAKQEIQNLRDIITSSEANADAVGNVGTNTINSPNTEQDLRSQGQLHISTTLAPKSSFSPYDTESPISRASSSLSLPADRPPVYSTLSDLLAAKPLVERLPFGDTNANHGATVTLSSAKEKEYQTKLSHLTELLNESEANHQRLLEQEKVLKEEIRNLDRAERRQNLSVDYLKNIVLKYLETSDREPLLPVLTTVLQLSPAEVASLRKKTIQSSASSLVGGLFGGGH
ncbi:hypothetical protein BGX21_000034 [Mortierella sp. AD011]|nr:hypothetical protein BGX20_009060 [Mortierella sp. AD010]KAF9404088.1 hypothetical protein BGX21_000034 [Mortierella sp. AD011]